MDTLWTSAIAVLGTLLGSAATHAFQQQTARRGERLTREERLRQERLAAYTAFSRALTEYRRSLYVRFNVEHERAAEDRQDTARWDTYTYRSAAEQALVHIRLLPDDAALVELAQHALTSAHELRQAADQSGMSARRERAKVAHDAFLAAAADRMR
ncbi:hypothetical protein [Streptomyces sp. XD-27]|uniref:hypothetical protein n=1 Tax=Streptomyces sp. XD-27 TaxID=3062779 RepID=UPI0026F47756|nr:hypothetical protein [Streptomyces sp. XD-27]WKX73673.1 hypothetical protein Q3Y56_30715 [Streptomyces sp. XD-27]